VNPELDVEQFDALLAYLRERGQVRSLEKAAFTKLEGGVSNRTVLVECEDGRAFVVKQALERLRVATEWQCDRRRIEREALGLLWLRRLLPAQAVPALLFVDPEQHLLAMEAVPRPHENWKHRLLSGRIDSALVQEFGELLGQIHQQSREVVEIERLFQDQSYFEKLRLEPYYSYTASRVPTARSFLEALIADTRGQRSALVHGDYSPKNALIHREHLVLLDHEVVHFGDPAFDVGFCLTHFLSKAHHLPDRRATLIEAAHQFWTAYRLSAGELGYSLGFEPRAARHILACLLARVEGRSPLEYFDSAARQKQREIVLRLISAEISNVPAMITAFSEELGRTP